MKTQNQVAQWANETLDSLNGLQQAEANNFLFAKIHARMQNNKRQQAMSVKALSGLSVALVLFIGLNVASYFLIHKTPKQNVVQQNSTAAAVASEYNLNTGGYNY